MVALVAMIFLVAVGYFFLLAFNTELRETKLADISALVLKSFGYIASFNERILGAVALVAAAAGYFLLTAFNNCFHAEQLSHHIKGKVHIANLENQTLEMKLKAMEKMTDFIEKLLSMRPDQLQTVFGLVLGDLSEKPNSDVTLYEKEVFVNDNPNLHGHPDFRRVGKAMIRERKTRKNSH